MTDWKENIRKKMSDYSEAAPDGLLDDILAAGERNGRQRRNIIILMSSLAAAALAVGVIYSSGPGGDEDIQKTTYPSSRVVLASSPEIIRTGRMPSAPEIDIRRPETDTRTGFATGDNEKSVSDIVSNDNDIPENGEGMTTDTGIAHGDDVHVDRDADMSVVRNEGNGNDSTDDGGDSFSGGYGWKDILLAEAGRTNRKGKPDIGVYASGFTGGQTRHAGYSQAVNTVAAAAPMSYGDNALAGIMMFNRSKEVGTESRHYMPVKAGVSVSYALTPRWRLESGITYSWLPSKFRSGSESYYVDSRQSLHYLGIPLNAGFNVWQNGWMAVYASAGGMMEKCVGGSVRSDYVYGGDVRKSEKEKLTVKQLQWSVGASAGLQFKLSGIVGLYLEPGVIYHFDNGSGVESAYSVHPLNFNLNLGLRFSFE